jgi:ABC-type dipeptide/oligopeptide/nickel transport system ATPase subunit
MSKELKDIADEIDSIFTCHRETLNTNERIRRLLQEALEVARTKYEDSRKERRRR